MPEIVPLSVLVITKNEEKRLPECLDSVRWAGELIVLDDESTDGTLDVARAYGAKILQRKMDVEGRHRNYGYAQAKYEWVLSIDADERVTPELRDEIIALLKTNPALNGYTMPRKNFMGKRWIKKGGWYPSPQLKLFRRDHFKYEESEVHPRAFLDTACGNLKGDLLHYSYRDLYDFIGKQNKQTTLEVRKWVKDGRKMPLSKALWRTFDRYYRSYAAKKGSEDGTLGYILAAMGGMYQFVSYTKYWAIKKVPAAQPGAEKKIAYPPAEKSTHRRKKISAVILTKNAAKKLETCLNSLRWADEIVLVDGGSTDETVALATAAGAVVVTDMTADNFGALRNRGTDADSGDWVLQLDADERITPAFYNDLEKLLAQDTSRHAAYKFRRENIFLGKKMRFGGWTHDSLHLFRKGMARYEGRVHEKLIVSGTVGRMKTGVEHAPFDSIEEFLDRQNRYSTLEARQWLSERGGHIPEDEVLRQIQKRPWRLFIKIYFRKKGFLDGTHGFLFSGLFAYLHLIKWAKVWEIQNAQE